MASWRHADALEGPSGSGTDADGVAEAGTPCAGPGQSARPSPAVVFEWEQSDGGGGAAGGRATERRPLVPALPSGGAHRARGSPPLRAAAALGRGRATAAAAALGRERPAWQHRTRRLDCTPVGGAVGCPRLAGECQDRALLGGALGCPLAAGSAGGQRGSRPAAGAGATGCRSAGRPAAGAAPGLATGGGLRGRSRPGAAAPRRLQLAIARSARQRPNTRPEREGGPLRVAQSGRRPGDHRGTAQDSSAADPAPGAGGRTLSEGRAGGDLGQRRHSPRQTDHGLARRAPPGPPRAPATLQPQRQCSRAGLGLVTRQGLPQSGLPNLGRQARRRTRLSRGAHTRRAMPPLRTGAAAEPPAGRGR